MQRIPTKVHGYVDYATGAFLLAAPRVLGLRDRRSATAMRVAGGGVLASSLLTDYELGVRRLLPMKAHLALDAGSGLALLASPWLRDYAFRGPSEWLGPVVAGMGEIAAAALTQTTPGDGGASASASSPTAADPTPGPADPEERLPVPPVPATDPVDSADLDIGMPSRVTSVVGGAAGVAADDPLAEVPIADPIAPSARQDVAAASGEEDASEEAPALDVEVPGGIAAAGQDDAAADAEVAGGEALANAAGAGVTGDAVADLGGSPSTAAEGDPLPGDVSADPEAVDATAPADIADEDLERAGPSGRAPQGDTVVSAPPPIDMPGPSVPAPAFPESETERAERADAMAMDSELLAERVEDPVEALIAEEEAAAAMEARGIGGPVDLDAGGDPAMEAVYQAGGGEAEGFELAEADLIENATHGEGHGDPLRDALTPEAESDRSSAEYSEPDEEEVTEVVADPEADPRTDPGTGPGIATER